LVVIVWSGFSSVSATTKIVITVIIYGERYLIQPCVIKFVGDFRHVRRFLKFPQPIKLTVTIFMSDSLKTLSVNVVLCLMVDEYRVPQYNNQTLIWIEMVIYYKWRIREWSILKSNITPVLGEENFPLKIHFGIRQYFY
jgi:hypothetical protein